MAKRTRTRHGAAPTSIAPAQAAESKLEEFAEDLGRLLGQAQSKAEGWLGQRQAIADHLVGVRDTATKLLAQLGISTAPSTPVRGRPAGVTKRGPGRPAAPAKKKRTMSASARKAISEAQKARWAKQKKAAAKE